MKAKYIAYQNTHSFSKFVIDYVNNKIELKPFYAFRPDIEGLKKAIENRNFTGNRTTLLEVLKAQYANIKVHQSVKNNIDLLVKNNTFTVTTGHQLNLFTGPLYFIYKIVSTINLAIELKKNFPNFNFVPIYWMATEDHDFEEINYVNVDEKNISWIQQSNGATGRLSTQTVVAAVQAYKGYLGISQNGKKLAQLVEQAYLRHNNLADATRALVNSLFEQYGLVIVNADHIEFKKQFAKIMVNDILHKNSQKLLKQTNTKLTNLGYKTQANGREINFFYLDENLREQITERNDKFWVNNTKLSFTKEELESEINNRPDRFSPNVIMRPLYQEVILPNIAYIGGGAEIAYWMQLKANFGYYKIDFPTLLLRNSALLIDKRTVKNLKNLGFTLEDAFLPAQQLKNSWIAKNSKAKLTLKKEIAQLQAIFDQIREEAKKIDKTLEPSGQALKAKTIKLVENFEKKLFRAEKRKHEISLQQIENIKHRLFPLGGLQERNLNLAPMFVNYGVDFISSCIENFDPLGGNFTILFPDTDLHRDKE